jgi:hypothetical protein
MAKKEISVWIRAKDGFSQMFRRVGTHLDRLRSRAATVFRAVGGAARLAGVGIAALAGAAALAVREFTKQEDAERSLTAALQNQGQATEDHGREGDLPRGRQRVGRGRREARAKHQVNRAACMRRSAKDQINRHYAGSVKFMLTVISPPT